MKTIAPKTNPAFKLAQHLPVWLAGLPGRDDTSAAARNAELPPSGKAAPREAFDCALFSMPAEREACTAVSR